MITTTQGSPLADYLAYDNGTDKRYELENGDLIELPSESDLNHQIAMFPTLALTVMQVLQA